MGIDIRDEIKQNFVDFAYEANCQRAFPSALDGLKPGQRACLWEFFIKNYSSSKPHVKSAKASGGIIGSWWPHGDSAIYETFARMSQPWINNIPEIDWHGNNGSQTAGPEPAAARYTEARLSEASEDGFFTNIKKDTVDMILNFSEDDEWPSVLPAIFPRLYVNGSQGIGMAMANSWLPGNLNEFTKKVDEYCRTGDVNCDDIYPDFPSGGVIVNKDEIKAIYETGKGKAVVRASVTVNDNNLLITQLPYQVYAEDLINSIKDLVNKEEIDGIKDIYNKSSKDGLLIEIECDKTPLVVLEKLFALTDLQKTYSANQYALITKVPELLTLKDYIKVYVEHNLNVINREARFDLNKAEDRLEIVKGLILALENIDAVITVIKQSKDTDSARYNLIKRFNFTERQANAILDMKLAKLTHLDNQKLLEEKDTLIAKIEQLNKFLLDKDAQVYEFLTRLQAFTDKYGWKRRTNVINVDLSKKKDNEEEKIKYVEPEQCIVAITESGFIKRVPNSLFKVQKRNGTGIKTQDDITSAVIRTNTVDSLMIFTDKGNMYRLLVNDIPEGNNASKGSSVKALVPMDTNEKVEVIYSIYRDTEAKYVLFITKNGIVKKTPLEEYVSTRKKSGVAAIKLKGDDTLAAVTLIKDEPVLIITANGMVIKLDSNDIVCTARVTAGVKGITLKGDDTVVAGLPIRNENDTLGIFVSGGLGKRVKLSEFNTQKRGGKGVITYRPSATSGQVVDATLLEDSDNVLIVGASTSICISAADIPTTGRAAMGSQILKTGNVMSVSKV